MSRLRKNWWLAGLLLAAAVAVLSPLASQHPDGLERVAEDAGISRQARESPLRVIPNYVLPGIHDERLATVVSGLLGVAIVFTLVYGLGRLTRSKRRETGSRAATARRTASTSGEAAPPPTDLESNKR